MASAQLGREGLATRQKLILSGLYLSKFDSLGVKKLGFENFAEAFNVIGYALGSRPASIKNYRDEFDPLFPNNPRKGWHKRSTRDYCLAVFKEYDGLDLESFTSLVKSFFGFDENLWSEAEPVEQLDIGASSFAQRLITGIAAEQYFESIHAKIPEFNGYLVEDTTRFGCGYDFRLRSERDHEDLLAIEVKGLKDRNGSLLFTPKEYDVASELRERFFLFVVKNFRESPYHEIFRDPLSTGLQFRRTERITIQVSWLTTV
jgi:Domain of unknown function (DUF3883)